MTALPRVLVLSIATRDAGGPYDGMKRVLKEAVRGGLPPGWTHKFVYAGGEAEDADDVVVDVQESLVPGVARKTLAALKRHAAGYDYVIRTNLSTLWLWDRLQSYIDACPRTRFFGGTVDALHCGDHVCGCCMIWSRDVVEHVLEQWDEVWDSPDPDDVVLTRVCGRYAEVRPVPRLDVYGEMFPGVQVHHAPLPLHDCLPHVTHVRFKSNDRYFDAATMEAVGLVIQHLRTTAGAADLLLAVHLAQCMVLGPMLDGQTS